MENKKFFKYYDMVLYDLTDKPIAVFTSYEEVAKFFNTSVNSIKSALSRYLRDESIHFRKYYYIEKVPKDDRE